MAVLAIGTPLTAWSQQDSLAAGVALHSDLTYTVAAGRPLKLDLYLPKDGPAVVPVVLLIHGERPSERGREYYRHLAALAVTRGDMAAAVIEYRNAADAAYPGAIDDARAAVRWLRTHAEEYRINPRRIGAGGENFGGYVAAMLALDQRDAATAVQAVAIMSPVTDLSTYAPPPDRYPYHYAMFLRYPRAERPELWRAASPLTHASRATVPFFFFHGTDDPAVPLEQSTILVQALRNAGANVELMEITGAGNGLLEDQRVRQRVMRRFVAHLRDALRESPGVVMMPDLVYSRPNGRDLRLDLFRPEKRAERRPAIVFVHGGGWLWGNKKDHWPTAAHLASRGFVTASIEYRLARERIYPAALDDVRAAVAWLQANAERYGIDPQRIGAAGSSAGGHLVAMLGVVPDSSRQMKAPVKAVAAIAAPVDLALQHERDRFGPALFLGAGNPGENRARWAEASPINHVNRHAAAFLFLHGTKDGLVSYAEMLQMSKKLKDVGVVADVFSAEGGPHDFFLEHPWRWPAVRRIEEFFARTLGSQPSR